MKNNRGMAPILATILIIILVLGVSTGIYFVAKNQISQSVVDDKTSPTACSDSTGTLVIDNYSALVGGTDPSPTYYYAVISEGKTAENVVLTSTATSGTTTIGIGKKIVVFGTASDYIDTYKTTTMECGGVTVDFPMYYSTSDNPSIRIKNDDGDFMADSSNAVVHSGTNQTNVAVGETINLEVEIQGTNGESSGEGVLIVEFPANSNANITSVTLDGQSSRALPTVHSAVNAGSKIVAFDVPATEGASKTSLTLSISLASTKDLEGNVLVDWYAKQWFIDDDKTLTFGIEDSDGTAKYENTLDYDFRVESTDTE